MPVNIGAPEISMGRRQRIQFSVAAPYAAILPTIESRISPELLFGNSDRAARPSAKGGKHTHPDCHHWQYRGCGQMSRGDLASLTQILQQYFFRIKGIVQSAEDPAVWLSLQVVGKRAVIRQLPQSFAGKHAAEIVGIGIGPIIERQSTAVLPI
ncbi:GTP-binding protein [Roseovarius sp. C7]|uniref:GTP-binding protein n=1 Tax=Roseovarius sp. C7 TaxID=3398643 RepID=UPI0039F6AB4F